MLYLFGYVNKTIVDWMFQGPYFREPVKNERNKVAFRQTEERKVHYHNSCLDVCLFFQLRNLVTSTTKKTEMN